MFRSLQLVPTVLLIGRGVREDGVFPSGPGPAIRRSGWSAEHVRVPANQLVHQVARNVVDVESAPIARRLVGDPGVEEHL